MLNKQIFIAFISCFFVLGLNAQTEKDTTSIGLANDVKLSTNVLIREEINPLAPSKAAFFSAILPGLGQAYNKKYWKVPIVLAGITGGVLVFDFNSKQLNRYRDAYKRRLAGFTDDEFYGSGITPQISDDGLIRAQRQFRRNKDISLLVTIGIYALNIIDANVDAHLLQYNVDENLAIRPHIKYNEMENSSDLGLTLNFKF